MTELKLKTLKDIDFSELTEEIWVGGDDINEESPMDVLSEDKIKQQLRQEAIKWIKEIESHDDFDKYNYTHGYCLKHRMVDECYDALGISWSECSDIPAVISFIKHFFNITDMELAKCR